MYVHVNVCKSAGDKKSGGAVLITALVTLVDTREPDRNGMR